MARYKVRNWSQYNRSLENRGSLNLWINEDAINKWKAPKRKGIVGAPMKFSDEAILCIMALKVVLGFPYRQLVGYLISILSMMSLNLPTPHFTTIATRAKGLEICFSRLSNTRPADLVFDSSGFKIYGEGEWSRKKHGKQKTRRWKKFHIGVCPQTHQIVVAEVTELESADCMVAPEMMKKAPRSVKRVIGDGAYDTEGCYEAAHHLGISLLTPPRKGAVSKICQKEWLKDRDDAIYEIINLGNDEEAKKLWKKMRGYHRRSLVETAFSRLKGCFGGSLFSKSLICQEIELMLKTYVMNKFTGLGMPKGVMV